MTMCCFRGVLVARAALDGESGLPAVHGAHHHAPVVAEHPAHRQHVAHLCG